MPNFSAGTIKCAANRDEEGKVNNKKNVFNAVMNNTKITTGHIATFIFHRPLSYSKNSSCTIVRL